MAKGSVEDVEEARECQGFGAARGASFAWPMIYDPHECCILNQVRVPLFGTRSDPLWAHGVQSTTPLRRMYLYTVFPIKKALLNTLEYPNHNSRYEFNYHSTHYYIPRTIYG